MFSRSHCLRGAPLLLLVPNSDPRPLCPTQLPQKQGQRGRPRGPGPRDTTNSTSCPASQFPQFHGAHLEPLPPTEHEVSVCFRTSHTQKVLRERDTGAPTPEQSQSRATPPPHLWVGNGCLLLNFVFLRYYNLALEYFRFLDFTSFSCPFGFTLSFHHHFYPYLFSLLEPFSLFTHSFKQFNSLVVTTLRSFFLLDS